MKKDGVGSKPSDAFPVFFISHRVFDKNNFFFKNKK